MSLKKREVTVELKNEISVTGTLISVDDNMNIVISINKDNNTPSFLNDCTDTFVRGNNIKYIHMKSKDIDFKTLESEMMK